MAPVTRSRRTLPLAKRGPGTKRSTGKQDFHFHAHSHSLKTNSHNSHTFCGHNEIRPDEADLEYITSILESFANLETMSAQTNHQKKHQHFGPRGPNDDAPFQACKKHQATRPKFNYELLIKMPVLHYFSGNLTLEPDTLGNWNKNIRPEEDISKTEEICAITKPRIKTLPSTWSPFVSSNLNKVMPLSSNTWSYSPQSPSPRKQHRNGTTSSLPTQSSQPEISPFDYLHTDKTIYWGLQWGPRFWPAYSASPRSPFQNNRQVKPKPLRKLQKTPLPSINNWIKQPSESPRPFKG
jgi:hypothetical protein